MNTSNAASICKALGDPNRLKIVEMLTEGEMCACKLLEALAITQPTLSHHMKKLSESNLVNAREEGKWTYYSLNCQTFSEFRTFIGNISCSKETRKK